MDVISVADLSARQKAAIVVMTLGSHAQELLKQLGGSEVERLAGEILQLGEVPRKIRDEILTEFYNRLAAKQAQGESNLERAARVLEASLGKAEADQAVKRIEWRADENLRGFARRDPAKFADMVQAEHPQTVAFLLTRLEPETSGQVVAALPEDLQPEMAWRIATMDEISAEAAGAVHRALAPRVEPQRGAAAQSLERLGGEKKLAGVLNMVPLTAQKSVLDILASRDEGIAKRVRKLMFVFRDLLLLDDRSMQRVLKEIDLKDLSLALKNADADIKEKIFKNVSERAAQTIEEEMEYMGPVKASEIEEAQDRIIERARALEEQGEIVINRGGASGDAVV